MGHHSHHKAYGDLQHRLNHLPSGFPDTEDAFAILRMLFSDSEAELVARMPFRPRSVRWIARHAGRPQDEVRKTLEQLADRGMIFDFIHPGKGQAYYCIAPPIVGFFELSMMRRRQDIDQAALSRVYEDFFKSNREFVNRLFGGDTTIGRVLVHENVLQPKDFAELLTFERAKDHVQNASSLSVSLCYCRHKAQHLGRSCAHPLEICLSLNYGAEFVNRHGHGRPITASEALEIIDKAREGGLVHIADNIQRQVTYICNCCGCCCEQLRSINQYGVAGAVKTSGFIAHIDQEHCVGCGRCMRSCPIQAISLHANPHHLGRKTKQHGRVDEAICLGCGVCAAACKKNALAMVRRKERVLTPETTLERVISMALERGTLQHLLFDEVEGLHVLLLNRLVGAILMLPPLKRQMLQQQTKSRFVRFLSSRAS